MLVLSRREGETITIGDFEMIVLHVGEDLAQLRISHSPNAEDIFVEMWVGIDEEYRIGRQIVGKIAAIRNNGIGICIEAPREVKILRGEIADQAPTPTSRSGNRRFGRRSGFPGIH